MQVSAKESTGVSAPGTARLARSASAGATPRGLSTELATPRSAAYAQDEEHRRWLEDLRAQYGHPAVSGALNLLQHVFRLSVTGSGVCAGIEAQSLCLAANQKNQRSESKTSKASSRHAHCLLHI